MKDMKIGMPDGSWVWTEKAETSLISARLDYLLSGGECEFRNGLTREDCIDRLEIELIARSLVDL